MLVGYLGPKGSFTHDVATHSFPTSERIAYRTITDVIKAYENQEIDFAVVPVENSIEGSVHETLITSFTKGPSRPLQKWSIPSSNSSWWLKKIGHSNGLFASTALAQGKAFYGHYPDVAME